MKRICEVCKKDFILNPRVGLKWAEKTGRGRFCSDACNRIHRKGMRVSPKTEFTSESISWNKHPRFKNGIWAYQKFKKDSCEICGSKDKLSVHHKDKDRKNNELVNLITLCLKCHWTFHKGKIPWNKGLRRVYAS